MKMINTYWVSGRRYAKLAWSHEDREKGGTVLKTSGPTSAPSDAMSQRSKLHLPFQPHWAQGKVSEANDQYVCLHRHIFPEKGRDGSDNLPTPAQTLHVPGWMDRKPLLSESTRAPLPAPSSDHYSEPGSVLDSDKNHFLFKAVLSDVIHHPIFKRQPKFRQISKPIRDIELASNRARTL